MARPLRIHVPGAAYHVMAKGNRGEYIFAAPDDKYFFVQYLGAGTEKYGIDLHAYCLMDNHYHLLLSDPERKLTPFMHFLGSSYGSHMRRRRGMIGHVFSGRYKSICVQKEKYLVELSRYIHLNPVRAQAAIVPEKYEWSSYRYYVGEGETPAWLNQAWILGRFGTTVEAELAYRIFVEDAIADPEAYPCEELRGQAVLGDESFTEKALRSVCHDREFGEVTSRRIYESPMDLKELYSAVCRDWRIAPEKVVRKGCAVSKRALDMFIWLAKEKTASTNKEIAALAGHGSPSSIPHRLRRVRKSLQESAPSARSWRQQAETIWREAKKREGEEGVSP